MSSRTDQALRRILREAHEGAPTPGFESVLRRRRPRRGASLWLRVGVAALLAVAVALPLHRMHRERQAIDFAVELASWQAPSDRWLESWEPAASLSGLGEPSLLDFAPEMAHWRNCPCP